MSFLAQLGITLLQHGVDCTCCQSDTDSAVPKLSELDTNFLFTKDCNTPETAVSKLVFGANSFDSKVVVVSKGYFLVINIEVPHFWDLFLFRPNGAHMRVAQIGVEYSFSFKSKFGTTKNNTRTVGPGVYELKPDGDGDYTAEFYFVSRI